MEDDVTVSVAELGRRARIAAADLAVRTRSDKDAALLAMAEAARAQARPDAARRMAELCLLAEARAR